MFHTGKLLAPGVKLGLKLYLNSPNFYLWETSIAAIKQVSFTNDVISLSLYLARPILNPIDYYPLQRFG